MKRLDELGVSPAPWRTERFSPESTENGRDINDDLSDPVGFTFSVNPHSIADARLIAAAPSLYECLREAVERRCGWCAWNDGSEPTICAKCDVPRWRKALEKAGGADE